MFREGKKCAIYVRVSTEMQVDGFSLDAQRNTLKKYAEREGMIVKDIYEDAGKSGKSIEGRPAFKQLLTDISNGLAIDYVLVYKLSRFGRNAADILNSLEFIQSYDINLIASEEGIDSSQTSGKLLISVLSAVSEIERENILEQTMNGRKEKARQGGWNGGFAPYGYNLVNGNIVVVPEEATVVKRIFEDFVEKNIPIGRITKQLNIEGITKSNHSNCNELWSRTSVKHILTNPIYLGLIAFGRRKREKIKGTRNQYRRVETDDYIIGDGKHEAIVEKEIWDKANAKMKKYAKSHNSQPFQRTYLLSGFLRCPKCGGPMFVTKNKWTTKDGKEYSRSIYRCSNSKAEVVSCDSKMRIEQEKADEIVIKYIREYIKNGAFAREINRRNQEIVDTSKYDKQLEMLEKRYIQVIEKKKGLEHQIDNMPLDTPYYERKINDLNKRLNEMYDVIAEVEEQIADVKLLIKGLVNKDSNEEKILAFLSMFDELVDEMTNDELRKCLSFIIHSITFDENNGLRYINCRLKSPKDSTELETMLLGKNDDTGIEYTIEIKPEDSITLTEFNNHRPRAKIIKTEVLETSGNVGRPKKVVTRIVDGEEVVSYQYVNGHYYTPKNEEERYKRNQITHDQIIEYIMNKYNVKIYSQYISDVKRLHGLDLQRDYIKRKSKYGCPKDKIPLIEEALIHFNIIKE